MLTHTTEPGGNVHTEKFDAAISLCSMALQKPSRDTTATSSLPTGTGAAAERMQQNQDSQSQLGKRLARLVSSGNSDGESNESKDKSAKAPKKRRTRKWEPRVTLDEMKRLMAIYGPASGIVRRRMEDGPRMH
mmetsp:Transcript_37632/g.90087  ORF Transcript_37632/g.90087 Transcript_37632/m.90087 type:complete len:133 (+) Transcript_37632:168-566(+)